jgi:hypothetical protein
MIFDPNPPSGLFLRRRPDPLLEGLVEWWDLDLAKGGTGRAGNFNLTKHGSSTQYASGGPGGLGYTAGSTSASANRYEMAHNAAFDISAPYTVAVWSRIPDPLIGTATQFYFVWRKGLASHNFGDNIVNSTSTPSSVQSRFLVDSSWVQTGQMTPWNGWNHWVYVRGDLGTNKIYLNGTQEATGTSASQVTNTGPLYIQSQGSDGGYNPDQAVSAWWARALSSAEVTRLYGGGAPLTAGAIGL